MSVHLSGDPSSRLWPRLARPSLPVAAILALVLAASAAVSAPGVSAQSLGDLARPAGALAARTTWYGTNLIVNPGAEDGPGAADGTTIIDAPGWTRNGSNATVITWQATSGSFPAFADPGPVVRGLNMFAGGGNNASSGFMQFLDLSPLAQSVDHGAVGFQLSGWLGGWSSQEDNARLVARFLNAGSATLDSVVVGPVSAAERVSVTGLWFRSATGTLPAGTRSVVFALWFTRLAGSYDDGYADSLAFTLSGTADVPAAGASALRLALSPNPARAGTAIAYTLPAGGRARVEVLDAAGRRAALLADGEATAGAHTLRWQPAGAHAAGLYFVRLTTPAGVETRKLVVLDR